MRKTLRFELVFLVSTICFNTAYPQHLADASKNRVGLDTRSVEFCYILNDSIDGDTKMRPSWYWGACVQFVYEYKESTYDKIFFMNRVEGSPEGNQPAMGIETLEALRRCTNNRNAKVFMIPPRNECDTTFQVQRLTSFKWPFKFITYQEADPEEHLKEINIYYYKKDDKLGDNLFISPDKVVIRVLWTQSSSKYEFSLIDSESRLESPVKVWVM